MKTMWLLVAAVMLAGCGSSSVFDQRYVPERAEFGNEKINVPPATTVGHVDIVNEDPTAGTGQVVVEQIAGTWTFVTPPTVTRVERKTSEFSQYSLYNGRPEATDTPFVVITVSADAKGTAETDPETYKVTSSRVYALNGNVAQEWTGNTKTGRGFCELVIKKPGNKPGDICHAMAIVKDSDEQKLALSILGSIKWTPNPTESPANQSAEAYIDVKLVDLASKYTLERQPDGSYLCVGYRRVGDGPWIRD